MSDTMRGRGWRAAAWRMVAFAAAVVTGAPAKADTLVPWADSTWKYVVVAPGGQPGFESPGFDDSGWASGRAPFGTRTCSGGPVPATSWPANTSLLARLRLNLSCPTQEIIVRVVVDDFIQVWVNGLEVTSGQGEGRPCGGLFSFQVPREALIAGDNIISVRATDLGGLTYFDASIDTETTAVVASPTYIPVFGGQPTPVQFTARTQIGFPCTDAANWRWQRRDMTVSDPRSADAWNDLADGPDFQGTGTPTLVIVAPTADLAVAYRCKVTGTCVCPSTGGAVRLSNEVRIGWIPNAIGWGLNSYGQLRTPENRVLEQVAINDWGSLGLCTDGSLVAWGDLYHGLNQLPSGRFIGITSSHIQFHALRDDGTIVQWGRQDLGYTLLPGRFRRILRGEGSGTFLLGISMDGRLAAFAQNSHSSNKQVPQPSLPSGTFIDVGGVTSSSYGYAIREGGRAVKFPLWTSNADAEVIDLFPGTRFVEVYSGNSCALFLAEDGTLWGDGGGPAARLPEGHFKSIAGSADTLVAVRMDGSVVQWTSNGPVPSTPPSPPGGFERVFAGWHVAYAITTPGCGTLGPVEVASQPSNVVVSPLSAATFAISTAGPSPRLYQWRMNGFTLANGGRISGADGPVLSIQSVRAEDQGRYDCVVAEGPACQRVTSSLAELSCRPVFQREPSNAMIAGGQSVPIDVEVTGFPTSLQWRKDGVPLRDSASYSGVNTATLWITGNDPNQSGSYDLVAVNACGSTVSTKATIVVTDGSGPACPGDFNGDGGVDGLDLFLFFERWEEGC